MFNPDDLALAVDTIGGGNLRIHFYETDDDETTVTAIDYFTKADRRGIRLGDIIIVHSGTDTFLSNVEAISAAGHAKVSAVDRNLLQEYENAAALQAAYVPPTISVVRLQGYTTAGTGSAIWRRVASQPTHNAKLHSADGTWWELAETNVDAVMLGAKGDSFTDCTAAINNALSFAKTARLPPGTFNCSGTINLDRPDNNYLIGAGQHSTFITCTSTTANAVNVGTSGTAPPQWGIRDLTVYRSVSPTNTAHGIYAYSQTNNAYITNVMCYGHWHGLVLGPAVFGHCFKLNAQNNFGTGVLMTNTASNAGMQWQMVDVIAQGNASDGILVSTVAGPAAATLGNWERITTFANTGRGVAIVSGAGRPPIYNIRWTGAFGGQNGGDDIYLDTYSNATGTHVLQNIMCELSGTGTTGPALATAATNSANGITLTSSNGHVIIDGFWVNGCSKNGILSSAGKLQLSSGVTEYCGQASISGQRVGIYIAAGSLLGTNLSSWGNQYGIILDTATSGNVLDAIDLSSNGGNSGSNLVINSTATDNEIGRVKGNNYRGVKTITVGASTFAYRAGPMTETVYLIGGAIIALAVDGANIFIATDRAITLPPNSVLGVAYSSAPTMKASVH